MSQGIDLVREAGLQDERGSGNAGQACTSRQLITTVTLRSTEDLREATQGADLRVIQLAPGPFGGLLTRAQIGTMSVSAGDFEPGIRARGVMNPDLVTIGMIVESTGNVMQWDYDVLPGDIVVIPKSVEQEGRSTCRSQFLTLTLSQQDLAAYGAGEGALEDPEFWNKAARFRPSSSVRAFIRRELSAKIAQLRSGAVPNSAVALDYFKRSLVEAFIVGVLDHQDAGTRKREGSRGSLVVRAVEDYVDAVKNDQPLHISELCLATRVTRRALHRAFHETLGIGPIEYLRLRRLSSVHGALSRSYPAPMSITRLALDAGFSDLGRFSAYYRKIYGETPSQTQRRSMAQAVA
ncbi:MAG TPA: helix-turn-helix domain-containing protein [Mesorhizobium sp.]